MRISRENHAVATMHQNIDQIGNPPKKTKKKVYEQPQLTRLGTLREMTGSVNAVGSKDGNATKRTGRGGLWRR